MLLAEADPAQAAVVATKATHRDGGRDNSSGSGSERRRGGDSNSGCTSSSDSGRCAGSNSGNGGGRNRGSSRGRAKGSGGGSDRGSGGRRDSANDGSSDVLGYVGGGKGARTRRRGRRWGGAEVHGGANGEPGTEKPRHGRREKLTSSVTAGAVAATTAGADHATATPVVAVATPCIWGNKDRGAGTRGGSQRARHSPPSASPIPVPLRSTSCHQS